MYSDAFGGSILYIFPLAYYGSRPAATRKTVLNPYFIFLVRQFRARSTLEHPPPLTIIRLEYLEVVDGNQQSHGFIVRV